VTTALGPELAEPEPELAVGLTVEVGEGETPEPDEPAELAAL
jgi:hypothetical protein